MNAYLKAIERQRRMEEAALWKLAKAMSEEDRQRARWHLDLILGEREYL